MAGGGAAQHSHAWDLDRASRVPTSSGTQLRADKRLIADFYGIQAKADPAPGSAEAADEAAERFLYGPAQGYSGKYKDDLTGQPLRDDLVKAARAKGVEFFCSK